MTRIKDALNKTITVKPWTYEGDVTQLADGTAQGARSGQFSDNVAKRSGEQRILKNRPPASSKDAHDSEADNR